MATLPSFDGWEDMSKYAANQAALSAQSTAPQIEAAKLGGVSNAGNVTIAAPAALTAQGTLANQRQFYNPYQADVINTSLANYDNTARQAIAGMQADAARNNAFGGSRYGIREGQTVADSLLGRATLDANLRQQGWNNALGTAMQMGTQNQNTELSRGIAQGNISAQIAMANANAANQAAQAQAQLQQQAALANQQAAQQQQAQNLAALGLVGNTANAYANNTQQANAGDRADLALIADLGAQQWAIELQQANALPSLLQTQGALMGAIPANTFTGQTVDVTGNSTTTQSGGLLGGILGGLSLIPTIGKVF